MTKPPTSTTVRPRRLRWRRIIVRNLIVVLLFYAAGSFFLAESLLGSGRVSVGVNKPKPAVAAEVTLRTDDGIDLSGWLLDSQRPIRGTVLLFHGIGDTRSGGWMPWLLECGYRSLAIDFRSHGKSGGTKTTFGWNERHDVSAAIGFMRERFPKEPILIWGVSMGGAAACYASRDIGEVAGVIVESCYATIDDAYDNRLRLNAPSWLIFLGVGPRLAVEWRGGLKGKDLRPVDHVRGFAPEKVFVIGGGADRLATPRESERIAQAVPGAELWIVPHAHHAACAAPDPVEYKRRVREFFDRRTAK